MEPHTDSTQYFSKNGTLALSRSALQCWLLAERSVLTVIILPSHDLILLHEILLPIVISPARSSFRPVRTNCAAAHLLFRSGKRAERWRQEQQRGMGRDMGQRVWRGSRRVHGDGRRRRCGGVSRMDRQPDHLSAWTCRQDRKHCGEPAEKAAEPAMVCRLLSAQERFILSP